MCNARILSTSLLAMFAGMAGMAVADQNAVLTVKGRGAEGKQPYRGGGQVKFLDVSLEPQVLHYGGGNELRLPLRVRYQVLQSAPILLTTRLGSEHWNLYSFDSERSSALYTDEKIDLSLSGERVAETARGWFGKRNEPLPAPGLAGIRGRHYFLIDQPNGRWLDVTDPPPFFDQAAMARKLTFTLANLKKHAISLKEFQSTWEPGGPLRVRLELEDADGKRIPVVNVPLVARAGTWQTTLATEWKPASEPTGWMRGSLPTAVPQEIAIEGTVVAQTPKGQEKWEVAAKFARGSGRLAPAALESVQQGYTLPRDARGKVRETRAIWLSTEDVSTSEKIGVALARCKKAGLNMLIPDIFVRNSFLAKSALMPSTAIREPETDPLAELIQKAHAVGLEVHPWFCVTYRDAKFRDWFRAQRGTGVDILDKDGKTMPLGADVHRPQYRDFIVDLMVGVAKDYPVDGIHLDYIRSMEKCYCQGCRAEFANRIGKPLTSAGDEDWVQWQREAIGDIVRRTAEGVRKVRAGAAMSAAVFSSLPGGAAQGQDPAGWARQGWIDLVLPMDYQMQTLQVRAHEREFLNALDNDDQLVTGLSLYMRSGQKALSRPADLVREQIELVRRMGIHGYCLFAYSHLSDEQLQAIQKLNQEPATPYCRAGQR